MAGQRSVGGKKRARRHLRVSGIGRLAAGVGLQEILY